MLVIGVNAVYMLIGVECMFDSLDNSEFELFNCFWWLC